MFDRDVSGVELLMNNHQSLKAEIDAREENFAICINLGRDLLNRNHYRQEEVSQARRCLAFLWSAVWSFCAVLLLTVLLV